MYVDASSHRNLDRRIDAALKEHGVCILTDAIDSGLVQRIQQTTIDVYDLAIASSQKKFSGGIQRKYRNRAGIDIIETSIEDNSSSSEFPDQMAMAYVHLLSATEGISRVLNRCSGKSIAGPQQHSLRSLRYKQGVVGDRHTDDDCSVTLLLESIYFSGERNNDLYIVHKGKTQQISVRSKGDLVCMPGKQSVWGATEHGVRDPLDNTRYSWALAI